MEQECKMSETIKAMSDDLIYLKQHSIECDTKHRVNNEHRRRLDDKLKDSLEYQKSMDDTMKQILKVLEENTPTIQRSKNTYTTIDTLKSWSLWIAAISGAVVAIYTLFNMIG